MQQKLSTITYSYNDSNNYLHRLKQFLKTLFALFSSSKQWKPKVTWQLPYAAAELRWDSEVLLEAEIYAEAEYKRNISGI